MDEQKNHSDFQPSEKKATDDAEMETAALSELHEIRTDIHPIESSQYSLIGARVGDCTIKRIIGSGGMGTVYEAIQDQTRRRVAVKMIKHGITSQTALRRFDFEIQLLARLRHPGIAQIYEAGTYDDGALAGGIPYFVMEFVRNAKTITEYTEEKKLGIRERLILFTQVCSAVQHGHLKGVVHRDLKPGNILVDSFGKTRIIDFGVAKSTDSDMAVQSLWTSAGQIIGTLQYMSPEQCNPDPCDIDTRSDLYSLGIILFELLSGKLPYSVVGKPLLEAVRIVQNEDPGKLSSIDRAFRGDLETIVLKGLEKNPERRYQAVSNLKEDIDCYLAGDPISARRPSYWFYLKRLITRHTAASMAVLTIFVTIIAAVYAVLGFALSEAAQRKVAEAERIKAIFQTEEATLAKVKAEQAHNRATEQAYFGNIHAADAAIALGDMSTARQRLEDAQDNIIGSNQLRELPFEWQYLKGQVDDSITTLRGHTQGVNAVAFNHDGSRLASGSADSTIRVWKMNNTPPVAKYYLENNPNHKINQFANTSALVNTFIGHKKEISAITFSPDGTMLASAGNDATVYIWDASTGEVLHTLQGHDYALWTVTDGVDEGGGQTPTGPTRLWDTISGNELDTLHGLDAYVFALAFSPSGNLLASGGGDRSIRLWDTSTGKEMNILRGHASQVSSVAFSPDGTRLVSASGDSTLYLWDTDTGEELSILRGHHGAVRSVVFSSDGALLASAGFDKTIRIWDAFTGEEIKALLGHEELISSVTFSNDDTQLVSGSQDNTIRIWDISSGKELAVLRGHEGWVSSVAFSPTSTQIASGSNDLTIRIWDPSSVEEL
jgi:WD40 repeat protein/serine/threonine-protein kinase RIO1